MKLSILLFFGFIVTGCASRSVLPSVSELKVSREPADKKCQELGPVYGRSQLIHSTNEQVLEDLKKDAANKGANYVVIHQYSGNQTAVNGTAYICP